MKKIFFSFLLLTVQIVAQSVPSVTIYVHGTQQVGSQLLPKDVWYCQKGLHHISELPDSSMLVKDAKLLQQGDALLFDVEHYYTFGWSGKLSFKAREKAGKDLYEDMQKLLKKYKKKYKVYPTIRLLTFSHGGNVALNMVKYLPFIKGERIPLDLILVACPVQKVTEDLINHTSINRSFVISSKLDLLQVADIYKYNGKRYVPNRFFQTDKDNCYQIAVTVNHKRLGHVDLWHSFMRHIPATIHAVLQSSAHQKEYLHDVKDAGFTHYRVVNLPWAMRAHRKESK